MILEVVNWVIKPNHEKEFEIAFEKAQKILSSMDGYISHQFQKCLEHPNRYILLVQWRKLEDHTLGFQKSDEYQKYRALLSEHYEPDVKMQHYELVHENAL